MLEASLRIKSKIPLECTRIVTVFGLFVPIGSNANAPELASAWMVVQLRNRESVYLQTKPHNVSVLTYHLVCGEVSASGDESTRRRSVAGGVVGGRKTVGATIFGDRLGLRL